MTRIHTIGDSHAANGWRDCPQSRDNIHHIGSTLCYNVGTHKLERCNISTMTSIQEGETIVFCFGEIDCRCHVHKHITETMSYKDIIDSLVNNYFDAIELNIVHSGFLNLKVCVYNVVPPIEREKTAYENPEFPFVGSDEERKQYVLFFNSMLKKKCFEKGYIFVDIFEKYATENGFMNTNLSDGNVHILDKTYLEEFIVANIM